MTRAELLEGAKALPRDEQIDLALDLWDSIAADAQSVPASEAELEEIDRRIDDYERDPTDTMSWEELQRQLLGGHGDAIR